MYKIQFIIVLKKMWKKIGVKNQGQSTSGTQISSPRSGAFQRVRPLDEKSLVEKDNSFSKNSVNSSKMSSGKAPSGQPQLSQSGAQTPKLAGNSPTEDNFIFSQQVYTPKALQRNTATKMSYDSLPRYFPGSPQSRDSLRHARISQTLPQSPGSFSSPLHQSLQYPLQTNQPHFQAFIERLQNRLTESQKVNRIYGEQLKELRRFVLAMRRDVVKEIGAFQSLLSGVIQNVEKNKTEDRRASEEDTRRRSLNSEEENGYNVRVYPPMEGDAHYKQEIENVMLKIEDLRHDVQNTAVFKQEIFNRIDSNLRRIEDMKNARRAKLHR